MVSLAFYKQQLFLVLPFYTGNNNRFLMLSAGNRAVAIVIIEDIQKIDKNAVYTSAFIMVIGIPILKNSKKVIVCPAFFSALCIIMTLLAAPKMDRFPAIVLPAARAIISFVAPPACPSIGI